MFDWDKTSFVDQMKKVASVPGPTSVSPFACKNHSGVTFDMNLRMKLGSQNKARSPEFRRTLRPILGVAVSFLVIIIGSDTTSLPSAASVTAQRSISTNWAGFAVKSPNTDVQGVFGQWIVPRVSCPATGDTYSSTWVGLGGVYRVTYESGGVEWLYQTGTSQYCLNGAPTYDAWTEEYNGGIKVGELPVDRSVLPGDHMIATAVQHLLYTLVTLVDVRNGSQVWSSNRHFYFVQFQSRGAGHTAECVEEAYRVNGHATVLANFGTVRFSQCQASDGNGSVHNVIGSSQPSDWQSVDLEMDQGGQLVATTSSPLTIKYQAPSAGTSPGGGGSGSGGSGGAGGGGGSGGTGGSGSTTGTITIGWSTAHPTWITMTLDGFTPGTYTYTCDFASGGDASFSLTESTDPQTFDNGATCYDAEAGDKVWVTIGSVMSNTITVSSGGSGGGGGSTTGTISIGWSTAHPPGSP